MLSDWTSLAEEKWLGTRTEQEELDVCVFLLIDEGKLTPATDTSPSLLYIHTKLMIVDDKRVIMGSANLNDRSQKGDGDSEIALVVEDDDMLDSTMDGKPDQVARFAASLRRKLFREHLGLIQPQLVTRDETTDSFMRCAPTPQRGRDALA
ncbi:hypothetical protein C8F04DRAFT_1262362 [Mycena alexandri]|uniref:phospholipase D n=1 Tax=Mycena alexandri TaxID=1745969 RepID=A0AAD6SRS5_9AGAR|nr:hypothetical protein C8F04DRAFT_1262362 [Mycena alexandri]